jgi:AcrR family transcriptional regulator
MSKRLAPDVRSGQILDAAVKLARRVGWRKLTRDNIAKAANVSTGLVSNYFGSMDNMRDEVMKVAVRDSILPVIAQGVADRNKVAMRAPAAVRQKAVANMAA